MKEDEQCYATARGYIISQFSRMLRIIILST